MEHYTGVPHFALHSEILASNGLALLRVHVLAGPLHWGRVVRASVLNSNSDLSHAPGA